MQATSGHDGLVSMLMYAYISIDDSATDEGSILSVRSEGGSM